MFAKISTTRFYAFIKLTKSNRNDLSCQICYRHKANSFGYDNLIQSNSLMLLSKIHENLFRFIFAAIFSISSPIYLA